jgi:hypothetical protein
MLNTVLSGSDSEFSNNKICLFANFDRIWNLQNSEFWESGRLVGGGGVGGGFDE